MNIKELFIIPGYTIMIEILKNIFVNNFYINRELRNRKTFFVLLF